MNTIRIGGYERISKSTARKFYNNGLHVCILPHKMRPNNMWMEPARAPFLAAREPDDTFDKWVNYYTAYNCNYELGYYPAFYVKK